MSQPPRIYDVSVPIRPGMPVYEGDPDVTLERVSSVDKGDMANVSRIDFGVHTGTHIDAPAHFIEGGRGVDELDLDVLLGRVQVVDATDVESHIDAAAVARLMIERGVQRVIFKTRNSQLWERSVFSSDFVALTEDAARTLVERGVKLVGIDYLSIAPKDDPSPTHRVLLEAGIVIVEGLDLRDVPPGTYELICLPLRIAGADGAPARVLLRETR
jgi:arylformamidase